MALTFRPPPPFTLIRPAVPGQILLAKLAAPRRLSPGPGSEILAKAASFEPAGEGEGGAIEEAVVRAMAASGDAEEALGVLADRGGGGTVGVADCCRIVKAALDRSNVDLAFSIVSAMRSSFDSDGSEQSLSRSAWKWARPDVRTYASLVVGLASLLRVSDAIRAVSFISRIGDSGCLWENRTLSNLYDSHSCSTTSTWYPSGILF